MSGVSIPVTRPIGRALIVGSPACRSGPLSILQRLGYACAELDDPYGAMIELCRRPLVYRAMILSLASLYREELHFIDTVKKRFPHVEVWLTHTDGRQAALAEAMRLGADGLISDDGLHRTAGVGVQATPAALPNEPLEKTTQEQQAADAARSEPDIGEPVLTTDELRALLQEQPSMPPDESGA